MGQGLRMIGTQRLIYDVMPVKEKGERASTIVTDLESTKQIGRQILGNVSNGASRKESAAAPAAILRFLRSGSSERAVNEFTKWGAALDAAFGPRKFIKLDIAASDVYKN